MQSTPRWLRIGIIIGAIIILALVAILIFVPAPA